MLSNCNYVTLPKKSCKGLGSSLGAIGDTQTLRLQDLRSSGFKQESEKDWEEGVKDLV